MNRALFSIALLAACSRDVKLGDFPDAAYPDAAAPDAVAEDAQPFDAGPRDSGRRDIGPTDLGPPTHDFFLNPTPVDVMCFEDLSGHEDEFRTITATSVGFIGGEIVLVRGADDTFLVGGPGITESYGLRFLRLEKDPQNDPSIYGTGFRVYGPAPMGTTRDQAFFAIDGTSFGAPAVYAASGVQLIAGTNGANLCALVYEGALQTK
jgi:hypothetical protein